MSEASEAISNNNNKTRIIIAISAAVVVIVVAVCITVFALSRNEEVKAPVIDYASEAVVLMDQDAIQAAIDEAQENARGNMINLSYQNNAFSNDGKIFSCYIANSQFNLYDMFIAIFADPEMTDQLYLSGLVRPGSGFKEIELDRALDPGDHTVYVVMTQVDTEEDGTQVIVNQFSHTVEFHVNP